MGLVMNINSIYVCHVTYLIALCLANSVSLDGHLAI